MRQRRMHQTISFGLGLAVSLGAFALGQPAGAQSLEEVDALARAGRVAAARAELLDWFAARAEGASTADLQRGLWLRAILTLDPTQANLDLTRLALEYPGGPFSEGAVLRLAEAAVAAGDRAAAERHWRRLARDYPSGAGAAQARAWLESASVEAAPTPATATPVAPAADERGAFTVQVGAFANEGRARDLQQSLEDAGFDARLTRMPGSDLARVRVGRFASQAEAESLLARLRRAGFEGRVAADARDETAGS